MDTKELIKQIRALFADAPAPAPADTAPAPDSIDIMLPDGKVLSCKPNAEPGAEVSIDGAPAPDGDYEGQAADGSPVKVSVKDGKVAAAQEAPTADDEMSKFKSEFAAHVQEFGNFKTLFSQVQTEFAEAKNTIGKQQEAITGLLQVVEQLSKTPVAQPAAPTPSAFSSEPEESAVDRAKKLAANFKAK
jgi:hypothetical protein